MSEMNGIIADVYDPDKNALRVSSGGGGGGAVDSVVAGAGISVDDTDPANPIVSASGGINVATVHVTGEQLATLSSVPLPAVIPAPGADKIIVPLFATFEMVAGTADYDFSGNGLVLGSPAVFSTNLVVPQYQDLGSAFGDTFEFVAAGANGEYALNPTATNWALFLAAGADPVVTGAPPNDGDLYVTVYYTIGDTH